MSRHELKQGAPVTAAAIALTVLSFFLGAMTATPLPLMKRQNPHHYPIPQACAAIAEIDASGNDLYAGAR